MKMLRLPVFFYTMLLVAGQLLQANFAFSLASFESPNCMAPCVAQHETCFNKVKDAVNDIERELCDNEKKECVARCEAEIKELIKEYQQKVSQEQEERKSQGILRARPTAEEREEIYENAEQEKQERLEQAAREQKEQQDKAAQEKLKNETIDGIKILKFDN